VPVTIRDSTYVLDEICNNETELPIREHATDTAGATEVIFALFDPLGYRFAPRLRDLGDRRLFSSGPIGMHRYPRLQPYVTSRIQRQCILAWWDELLRVAGSLKLGWVTASLPQKNALILTRAAPERPSQAGSQQGPGPGHQEQGAPTGPQQHRCGRQAHAPARSSTVVPWAVTR
jgi:Tn3 transposase DDE domain